MDGFGPPDFLCANPHCDFCLSYCLEQCFLYCSQTVNWSQKITLKLFDVLTSRPPGCPYDIKFSRKLHKPTTFVRTQSNTGRILKCPVVIKSFQANLLSYDYKSTNMQCLISCNQKYTRKQSVHSECGA